MLTFAPKRDVAVVDVALMYSATTGPTTENFAYGEEVPIPIFPVAAIKSDEVPVRELVPSK
jgi:hypothetical protein